MYIEGALFNPVIPCLYSTLENGTRIYGMTLPPFSCLHRCPLFSVRQLVLSTSQDGDSLRPGAARWAQPLSAKTQETMLLAELGWLSNYGWHLKQH